MASYHVTLDGQGYMLELAKYVRRAHEPFVPMATFLNKLCVTSGSDGKVAEFDGTTLTNPAFTIAGSGGSAALATFYRQTAQYLYVGTSGTGPNGVGSVYWWDGATLSAKQYDFEETSPQAAVVLG